MKKRFYDVLAAYEKGCGLFAPIIAFHDRTNQISTWYFFLEVTLKSMPLNETLMDRNSSQLRVVWSQREILLYLLKQNVVAHANRGN